MGSEFSGGRIMGGERKIYKPAEVTGGRRTYKLWSWVDNLCIRDIDGALADSR